MVDMEQTIPEAPCVIPMAADVECKLAKHLPAYMVPKVLITMSKLPMTATGKLDRRRLREIGASFSVHELAETQMERQGAKRKPKTILERQMQQAWAKLLGVDPEIIGLDDSFFRLGGDSIAAMRLVSDMRQHGIELAVADIFRYPTLELAAQQGRGLDLPGSAAGNVIKPFSLLPGEIEAASFLQDVSFRLQLESPILVEDAYPCSPLQEGLLSLSMKRPGDYVMQSVLELAPGLDVEAFRRAWGEVARGMAILRTRVMQHRSSLIQVVLNEDIEWCETSNLEHYLEADRRSMMVLNQPLVRYALVKDISGSYTRFVWTLHHALYDDWSLSLIVNAVYQAIRGKLVDFGPQCNHFIQYLLNQDHDEMVAYWRGALASYSGNPFPSLPPSIQQPQADRNFQGEIFLPLKQQSGITTSNLLRAAWALVAGGLTNSRDVVFGMTMSGRGAKVPGLGKMAAPTITTVPVRVAWSKDQKVSDYVNTVQNQATDMIPFEQTGLQQIAKICDGSLQACQFQTLLVIQAPDSKSLNDEIGRWENDNRIGYGAGAVTWIVDPEDDRHLLPVGCVGELLLEGPIVGLGYPNNDEQTNAAFMQNPAWLQQGAPGHKGRGGRLYKTGDLVRYNRGGSMTFMGRKDDQVKIRGQRIELAEVEAHIKQALSRKPEVQVVAQVITPRNSNNPILVAFVSLLRQGQGAMAGAAPQGLLSESTQDLEDRLSAMLPSYMVSIPTTATGKIDRRALRAQFGSLTGDELASQNILRQRAYCAPVSAAEKQLQSLWASVLGLDSSKISADDSFLRIGGDSIQAMRLAGAAREHGLSLTVANIFKYPKLRDLAKMLSQIAVESVNLVPEPFSLLDPVVDRIDARSQTATMCQVSASQVLDIFP
ncbi:putative NRPS-like protein biosynthetic cluster [Claviceps citrina]|nr:putative NRPS-like protein biosynthetic cluster [Claviceps citrina]